MAPYQAQEFLFQRIKELLPQHISLVDGIAEILHISSDSAYRRIRSETPMVLDEVKLLCQHFQLSLDQLLDIKTGSTLFQNIRVNNQHYDFQQYLKDILSQLQRLSGFFQHEIIYLAKDFPIFHNFYYKPLVAFRYFFWMKTILQKPEFANLDFELNSISPEIESMSEEIVKTYAKIPSTEIWNTECINSTILQIEFYKDSGHFTSAADIRTVYDSLEETVLHLKNQVEYGCKFMPNENPQVKKNNFRFFYNRIILGDNTILTVADRIRTVFINYDVLNYLMTRDETFCNPCYDDMQNLMKRSTLISQTSEKQRNIFFGILLAKIADRKRHL